MPTSKRPVRILPKITLRFFEFLSIIQFLLSQPLLPIVYYIMKKSQRRSKNKDNKNRGAKLSVSNVK